LAAIKRKLGGAVRSNTFTAQRNEILVHAVHEIGMDPTFGKPVIGRR
jgi:hypothetical protein